MLSQDHRSPRRTRGKWVAIVLLVAAIVIIVWRLWPGHHLIVRECPHNWEWPEIAHAEGTVGTITQTSVAGAKTNVPEFHDCQQFLVDDGHGSLEYGALFAIFASERLETGLRTEDQTGTVKWYPAAEISAEADYEPLKIREGFSCLYLYEPVYGSGDFVAKIKHVGMSEIDCSEPVDVTTIPSENRLELERTQLGGEPSDYPPVARWDWDATLQQHHMGLKCGDGWCDVGAEDFTPSPPRVDLLNLAYPAATDGRRVVSVKGWYDEQILALKAGGGFTPSFVTGTIIPHPAVDGHQYSDYQSQPWVEVAKVVLSDRIQEYETKMNFEYAGAGRFNIISYCIGDSVDCPGTSALVCPAKDPTSDAGPPHVWARIEGAETGDYLYKCAQDWDMTAAGVLPADIPGTVRWRWTIEDEGSWERCPMGCCEVH